MYRAHWQLTETPFPGEFEARGFYMGPPQDEALSRMHFLITERRRVGILLGAPGSGKSHLLAMLASDMRRRGRCVAILQAAGLERREFLWRLVAELGWNPTDNDDTFTLRRRLEDGLTENRYQRLDTVLLIDDAGHADSEVQRELLRLAEAPGSKDAGLTLIAATSPADLRGIDARLCGLSQLRIDLEPWNLTQTLEFLRSSLARAGRVSDLFEPDAMRCLFERSGGVARRVIQIAEMALLAGASLELERIDSAMIDSVASELLDVGEPEFVF